MTFLLEADGVQILCSSPVWTRKLMEKGARLVDAEQAEYLPGDDARGAGNPPPHPGPGEGPGEGRDA
jgi:hypothetical protein